jgi:hypothetical protein
MLVAGRDPSGTLTRLRGDGRFSTSESFECSTARSTPGRRVDVRLWHFGDMARERTKTAFSSGADILALVRVEPVYGFTA